jgi:predicted HTH transcriptional regulator
MDYTKFRRLVKGLEKQTVDSKIECHAYNTKVQSPNAELAKDICAMANNGNVSSYILVGVSDDGRKFLSV